MRITDLAEMIHEQTGAEGAELECYVFYVSACFADVIGRKDIGDYFNNRLQESKAKLPEDHKFRKTYL